MVCTVTLNPALDLYLSPERFALGAVNRYEAASLLPGGKGVNVSLLLASLGMETVAMGIAAGFTGRELAAMLERAGCPSSFLFLREGLTRLNLKIESPDQSETALNGSGPDIPETALAQLEQRLAATLRPGDCLVLSGSLPAGLPEDTYARLARTVPENTEVVLDTSGKALEAGLKAKPFLVKPNREELCELLGQELRGEKDLVRGAKQLRHMGAKNVLVSLGGQGALLVTELGRVYRRKALPGREVSSVGAGDSMVAGFLFGWRESGQMETALEWGMAAGAATAFTRGIAAGEAVHKLFGEQNCAVQVR